VVFHCAGHGAQLDWRDYLLPVDAVVERQEHMRPRCVDLGLRLGQPNAAKGKTCIAILDVGRNNPLGAFHRPERKGLSQFEARIGLVPGLNFAIKREYVARNNCGRLTRTERHGPVSLRRQSMDLPG
jgi:hypothetical protein